MAASIKRNLRWARFRLSVSEAIRFYVARAIPPPCRPFLPTVTRGCDRHANFSLVMFKLKLDVIRLRCGRAAAGGAAMKSIHRSILTRALMTGVASLAFVMVSAGGVRAEITVQGDDGAAGADGVNPGDPACRAATVSR